MNLELFIANRLLKARNKSISPGSRRTGNSGFIATRPIIRIATVSIALGLAVMIIAVSIVTGFKSEIRDKVIGFGSHIQITNYDSNSSYEPSPIDMNQPFYPNMDTIPGIRHIQVFATKAGIIKTDEEIEGVVVKGIGSDFDWSFFKNNIKEGENFVVSDTVKTNDVLISKHIALKLKLNVGDDLIMYFIQKPPRMRKFRIKGIYETGLEEFDKLFVLADIAHIQKLNDWRNDQVGGFEVLIDDFEDLDKMGDLVYYNIIGSQFYSQTIKEAEAQIFDWLGLQNMNVVIILVLMIAVTVINMASALLVLILERVNMIGILKALGASNWSIRKIFLYISLWLIGRGLIWGNVIGLGLCIIQKEYSIFSLDQASYYVSVVPVNIDLFQIILLNIGTLAICILLLLFPTYVVAKVVPVKTIKFT